MADASVQVDVVVTSNTAGLKEVQAGIAGVTAETEKLSTTQQKLKDMGILFSGSGWKTAKSDLAAVTQEADNAGKMFEIGRFQAAALSREIANGTLNARTLGVSLASLGSVWSVAAIGAFTLFEVISKMGAAQQKLQEDAAKFNEELDRSVEKWERMAKEAEGIKDQVRLGDTMRSELQKAEDALKAFKERVSKESYFSGIFDITGTDQLQKAGELKDKTDEVTKSVEAQNKALNDAALSAEKFQEAQAKVTGSEGQSVIDEYTKKVADASTALVKATVEANINSKDPAALEARKQAAIDYELATRQLQQLLNLQLQYNAALEEMSGAINEIIKKNDEWMTKQIEHDAKAYTDQQAYLQKLQDEAAVRRATGDAEATITAKVKQLEDSVYETLSKQKDARGNTLKTEDEMRAIAQNQGESLRQQLETTRGLDTSQKTYNLSLHDAQTTLQAIRLAQTVIQGQPFLGADQKQAEMMQAYRLELGLVSAAMTKLRSDIAGGGLDPNVLEQDRAKLQQLVAQYIVLEQKIGAGTKPLQAELQTWANSFGSTMHQLAQTIEQTVGVALQSLNTYLTTVKFNAQQLLQSIIQLGLQLIEQLAIQQIVARINSAANAALALAAGKAIALAYGPAATAATIATTGAAAAEAPGAVAGALASIMAILGGTGMARGGYISGSGTGDTVPAMLAPGEYVINRNSAQAIGYGNLEEMNMYAAGGIVKGTRSHYQDAVSPDLPWDGWTPPDNSGDSYTQPPSYSVSTGPLENVSGNDPNTPPINIPLVAPPDLPGVSPLGPSVTTGGSPFFPVAGVAGGTGMGGGSRDAMAKLALHSSIFRDWIRSQGYRNLSQYSLRSGFHLPGAIGGGGGLRGAGLPSTKNFQHGGMVQGQGGGGVHIYAFTDLKQLTKHMSSREGQKIIFDTVKGRKIDLGIG